MVDYSRWDNLIDSDDEGSTEALSEDARRYNLAQRIQEFNLRYMEYGMRRQNHDACQLNYRLKLAQKKGNPALWYERLDRIEARLPQLDEEYARLSEERSRLYRDPLFKGHNRVGFAKTSINTEQQKAKLLGTNAICAQTEQELRQQSFVLQWKQLAHNFAGLRSREQSMRFLMRYPKFIQRDAIAYLMNLSVRLIAAGQLEQMEQVVHQIMILYFINEKAERTKEDPRSGIVPFFCRLNEPESGYNAVFLREIGSLTEHLKTRTANSGLQPLPLGPGGLDPFDVYEDLPPMLKFCFRHRDAQQLFNSLNQLPPEVAKHHLERCIDAGLWVLPPADAQPTRRT